MLRGGDNCLASMRTYSHVFGIAWERITRPLSALRSFCRHHVDAEVQGDEDDFSFRLMSSSQFEEWITGEWTAWPDVDDDMAIRRWPKELNDGVWNWIHDIWMM